MKDTASGSLAAPPWGPWLRWLGSIGAHLALLLAAAHLSPRVMLPPRAAYAVGFTAVCLGVLAASWWAPSGRRRALWLLLPAALSLVALGQARAVGLETAMAVSACLLMLGTLVGAVIGAEVEHVGHVLFVVLVSSLADMLSVLTPGGLSAEIVESPAALLTLALPWPMLGTHAIEPLLGVGDVVFTALYLAVTRAHGLSARRTAGALALAYLVTMLLVLATEQPVPALPLLGVAVLVAQPAMRRPPSGDLRRGGLGAVAVLAAVALFFLFRG